MKTLKHNTVCRRNRTASGVLLDVVNQSTRALFAKNCKVSRLTFKLISGAPVREVGSSLRRYLGNW